ncbi:MAG: DUF1015 family protein [Acetatifactor sp.]|nr:DUF1015 family protein [Acetatifactor sp.]
MAIIKPFKAYRPAVELADKIAALPYDVYNREEAKKVVENNPKSFLAIDRAETSFGDDVDTYDERVYKKAKELLDEKINKKEFIKEDKPVYYIYEEVMEGRSQVGIVAVSSIDDYQNNIIKKHENTRTDKEIDRIKHVDTCNMQTGPIFLAYRDNSVIDGVVNAYMQNKPVYDFVSEDNITHRVWIIDGTDDILTIQNEFEKTDSIYIADGHHRCASAVKVGLKRREENPGYTGDEEFNFFLSVLFPEQQLKIMDYNRVVKDLNGLSDREFLEKISSLFDIKENDSFVRPSKKGEIAMLLEGKWYTLSSPFKSEDPVLNLDVSILQNQVLKPILGIDDPKTDKRIDFVGGIKGYKELENRCNDDMKVAFLMHPTSIGELFSVADAGLLMPPKSTWFEPKLRSGIFLHELD